MPLAVGYRVDRQDPWQRRFFSWGYNTLVRTLLGTRVRDCDCALKVFRRDALAQIIPKYIPGNPSVVVSYMPGAGGIKAANYIYGVAPQDGNGLSPAVARGASSSAETRSLPRTLPSAGQLRA